MATQLEDSAWFVPQGQRQAWQQVPLQPSLQQASWQQEQPSWRERLSSLLRPFWQELLLF